MNTKKKDRGLHLLLPFVLSFYLATVVGASAQSASVDVKIYRKVDDRKEPVHNVKCKFGGITTGKRQEIKSFQTKTNKKGIANVKKVTPGKYRLRLYSSKFKNEYKEWSLPKFYGVVDIKPGNNSFEILSKRAVKVKGKISYQGNIDYDDILIYSNNSQHSVRPNQNGEFLLPGVILDEKTDIKFFIMTVMKGWSPTYKRVLNLTSEMKKTDGIIDVGTINYPRVEENEYIRILIRGQNGENPSRRSFFKNGRFLIIKNKEGTIYYRGPKLALYRRNQITSGAGARFRLPSGKYKAWWMGYKDQKVYEFTVSKKQHPTVTIRLPSNE